MTVNGFDSDLMAIDTGVEDHCLILDFTACIQMIYPNLHQMPPLRCSQTILQHFTLESLLMKFYSVSRKQSST